MYCCHITAFPFPFNIQCNQFLNALEIDSSQTSDLTRNLDIILFSNSSCVTDDKQRRTTNHVKSETIGWSWLICKMKTGCPHWIEINSLVFPSQTSAPKEPWFFPTTRFLKICFITIYMSRLRSFCTRDADNGTSFFITRANTTQILILLPIWFKLIIKFVPILQNLILVVHFLIHKISDYLRVTESSEN